MNKFLTCILLLLIGAGFVGCTKVVMKFYGVHQPRLESNTSINKFAARKKLAAGRVVVFRDSISFYNGLKLMSTPDMLIFKGTGEHVVFRDSNSCNAEGFHYSQVICDDQYISLDDSFQLQSFIKELQYLDGTPVRQDAIKDADYVAFLSFACFTGKLTKDHTREWQDTLLQQKNCQVAVYLLNMDFRSEILSTVPEMEFRAD